MINFLIIKRKIGRIISGSIFRSIIFPNIIICLFMISCRELVDNDFPDFDHLPVINSILANDSIIKVHFSFTDKIGNNSIGIIDNAEIITLEDSLLFDTLDYCGNSTYCSKFTAKQLSTYSCKVILEGYAPIECATNIPGTPEIISIEHIADAVRDEEGISYPAIKITFKNNPVKLQYFQALIKIIKHDWAVNAELCSVDDLVILNEGIPLAVFSNELMQSETYTMKLNYTDGGMNTNIYPVIIELRSITYDYYMYLKQLYLYEKGRYPSEIISGTVVPVNLYSNIEGGYGIFAGYSSTISDTIYPSQSY